ncbi:anaerobic ribonucleoside-triphosphate reductase activating protein [Candidatus Bathyarchaeota archaeon A05DMB-2]|jgi:pyruvate formate lyase activating enzyme|nr:anaerobic ribonucleoside-triphosphate reductase activating protein [Candidatus Bathyarchaeota archaeon A05DMB-2]
MKFSGLQKISLIDYPNKIASVLYTPGCNLRCPFCHNWRIAVDPKPPFLQEAVALEILESRKKYVDAVVVTGGEPCMHNELPRFLAKLKERGFQVKLDTNGFYPEVLEECLPNVDYVAVDVKTSPEKYKLLGAKSTTELLRTVELLKTGKVVYEFRTTVVPELVTAEDVTRICELVKGAKTHALQQFVPRDTLDKRFEGLKPYAPEVINEFAGAMKNYAENVLLRI